MTKTSRQRKCAVYFGDEKKFNESFPTDMQHERLRDRFLSLPEVYQPPHNVCWKEPHNPQNSTEARLRKYDESALTVRRHSWSSGLNSCGLSEYRTNNNSHYNPSIANNIKKRKISQESRKSSTASIPEMIEECSSDDEHLEEENYQNTLNSGLRCRNCFQIFDSTRLTTTSMTHNNNVARHDSNTNAYCRKCTGLLNSKSSHNFIVHHHGHHGHDSRRTHIDENHSPPRRARKTSLPDHYDLPSIVEPTYDEETNDTKEMQLIVEKEVNKLLNFNKSSAYYEKRRNSDNDINLLSDFRNMMLQKKQALIP